MESLDELLETGPAAVAAAESLGDLDEVEAQLVGRRSPLAEVRRSLGSLPVEDRPVVGRRVKEVQEQLDRLISERRRGLERAEEDQLLAADAVDPTLEVFRFAEGTQHVITSTIEEVTEIFVGLGYRVADGPEAETAWYNFDALNTPADHPARAESDTLYLDYTAPGREELLDDDSRYRDDREVLLRTQTSPMQARYMEQHDPPVYVVVPGRVFRSDTMDATHSPVFHQIEGLAVDTHLTMRDLRGTLCELFRDAGSGRNYPCGRLCSWLSAPAGVSLGGADANSGQSPRHEADVAQRRSRAGRVARAAPQRLRSTGN